MIKVLLITENKPLEKMLTVGLMINGIEVESVCHFGGLIDKLKESEFDAVMIDTLFGDEGSTLRNKGYQVPIMIFKDTPKNVTYKNVEFLSDPFNFPLLREKLNLMLHHNCRQTDEIIQHNSLKIDVMNGLVEIKNKAVTLGKMEFAILVSLARKAGDIVTREGMGRDLEAQGQYFHKSIFHHIKRLKTVLGETAAVKLNVVTGKGFQLIID